MSMSCKRSVSHSSCGTLSHPADAVADNIVWLLLWMPPDDDSMTSSGDSLGALVEDATVIHSGMRSFDGLRSVFNVQSMSLVQALTALLPVLSELM